eukprot:g45189.t1
MRRHQRMRAGSKRSAHSRGTPQRITRSSLRTSTESRPATLHATPLMSLPASRQGSIRKSSIAKNPGNTLSSLRRGEANRPSRDPNETLTRLLPSGPSLGHLGITRKLRRPGHRSTLSSSNRQPGNSRNLLSNKAGPSTANLPRRGVILSGLHHRSKERRQRSSSNHAKPSLINSNSNIQGPPNNSSRRCCGNLNNNNNNRRCCNLNNNNNNRRCCNLNNNNRHSNLN